MSINVLDYDMASGNGFSLVKNPDKTISVVGNNEYGQLGIGNNINMPKFSKSPFTDVLTVAAGANHSLFMKKDGTIWAAGKNDHGQLGIGNNIDQNTPVMISGLYNIMKIVAGNDHSLFLTGDGHLYACGSNKYGQLGIGNNIDQNVPVRVPLDEIFDISAGGNHSLALQYTGKNKFNIMEREAERHKYNVVYATGCNKYGQLGIGNNIDQNSFVKVDIPRINKVEAGYENSFFRRANGLTYATGYNENGELGIGNYIHQNIPSECEIDNVSDIAPGQRYTLFLKDNESVYGAGYSEDNNSWAFLFERNIPRYLKEKIAAVSTGVNHYLLLASDGSIITTKIS